MAHVDWTPDPLQYDDSGFFGGKTDRPTLPCPAAPRGGWPSRPDRHHRDLRGRPPARSLADFAKPVELFDQYNVSFFSVTNDRPRLQQRPFSHLLAALNASVRTPSIGRV
jgi:hypothetical protein